jgi:hypothetical protein
MNKYLDFIMFLLLSIFIFVIFFIATYILLYFNKLKMLNNND